MFHQLVTPVGESLVWSCLVASIPIVTVLVLLGVFRRPAWQASSAGLAAGLVLAIAAWDLPADNALSSVFAGATFALIPVMWIVFNALVLYNVTVVSGRFENFRQWMLEHLPNDRRVVLVVVGFCFGCLLEGIAGFGTPVAITSALLIALGFPALEALVFTLIFNTAPVAFGALGAPVTTLGAVTQLSDTTLGAMIGRQLPFIALLLPFYAVGLYGGVRAIRGVWPVLLIAGGSFATGQFIASNYLGFALTDVISSAFSLIVTIALPARSGGARPIRSSRWPHARSRRRHIQLRRLRDGFRGSFWRPQSWYGFTSASISLGRWPCTGRGCTKKSSSPSTTSRMRRIWTFQPLGTGTAILFATVLTAFVVGLKARQVPTVLLTSLAQIRLPALTTTLIIGLAYLMNYSGMTYTLGVGAASAGVFFPLLSAFLGWLAVSLSGSDTSGNALFGNLQVVAARQLDLDPVLMAATNSSGGVFGKMISPQNISTGTSTTELKGREGDVFARTFKHSVILTFLLGLLVLLQQYVFPWMIPS